MLTGDRKAWNRTSGLQKNSVQFYLRCMFPVKCLGLVYNTFISHVLCLMSVISVHCKKIRITVDNYRAFGSPKVHNYYNGDIGDISNTNVIGILGMDTNS
jgi:hypothetical protein